MNDFPGKWFDFTNHKEIRRLRNDLNDSISLKLQIASSIIVAIISFFLQSTIANTTVCIRMIVCAILCLVVLLIFLLPLIIDKINDLRIHNIIINGKDAVTLFDDVVTYNVLVASEYYNCRIKIPKNELNEELGKFYNIEIKYYITESIKILSLFAARSTQIIGNKNNQIPVERIYNILELINILLNDDMVEVDESIVKDFNQLYNEFCCKK